MASGLDRDIRYIKGVGEKRAQSYYKLGVDTIGALLHFYPRAYEDWSHPKKIAEAPAGEPASLLVRVTKEAKQTRISGGRILFRAEVTDGEDQMEVILFNNRFAAARFTAGAKLLLYGKVSRERYRYQMTSPEVSPFEENARIRPVYRSTEGLSSRMVEAAVRAALADYAGELDGLEHLPDSLRREESLCILRFALQNIHFPENEEAQEEARRRLIFEEFLILMLGLSRLKGRAREKTPVRLERDYTEEFFSLLPFTPTGAQRRAVSEAAADMRSGYPLNRLVQGDVGSGKTAVAAALCYTCAKNGWQAAFMAPTEILAEQHAETLRKLLEGTGLRVVLLTGSLPAKAKREAVEAALHGADIVVGTHALLSGNVEFARLGLVVTDEQHRFGVAQRAALQSKGVRPHLLVMSATPIPRTLALMVYGDLNVSVLDELPPGRTPVRTYAVGSDKRERVYGFIRRHLQEGRQAYIVCPLVEEGETDLVSAREYCEALQQGPFRDWRVGLLHGKLKPAEKEAVMRGFAEGQIDLLVATTVVEVGVDVPNAVLMVIENAERFGLSQLHQLRGRVGRGRHASSCVLISDAQNETALRRLKVMCQTTDGFRIADEDLKLRGPGDFFGYRQHGLPDLKIADMLRDREILQQARRAADRILKKDPLLEREENAVLRREAEKLFLRAGEEAMN